MKITISLSEKRIEMLDYLCDYVGDGRSGCIQNLILNAFLRVKDAEKDVSEEPPF